MGICEISVMYKSKQIRTTHVAIVITKLVMKVLMCFVLGIKHIKYYSLKEKSYDLYVTKISQIPPFYMPIFSRKYLCLVRRSYDTF